jgi:MFS transporter, DHA1 family, multidrug resistance protein
MLAQHRPSLLRLTLILGTLTASGPLSIDMYLPGLPALARALNTDAGSAQFTLAIFFIGMAVGQAIYGPLADRYGRRRPLLIGFAIYGLASLGCAFAPTIGWLIGLRLAQALGGCAGIVIARSVVRDCFAPQESARVYATLMLITGLAPILAPLIGGQVLLVASWRSVFLILAGFGLLCVALVAFGLPETLPAERRVPAGPGQIMAIYGQLLADRQFVAYSLVGSFVFAGMFAYIAGSPFVFIELYGVAPEHYGWIFGANALCLVLTAQATRWLLARFASRAILQAILWGVVGANLVLVGVAITGFGGLYGFLLPLAICVASVGLVGPLTAAEAMAPHGRFAGSASALLGTLQSITGALAGAFVGLFQNGTALPMVGVMAGCGIAALIAFQFIGHQKDEGAMRVVSG